MSKKKKRLEKKENKYNFPSFYYARIVIVSLILIYLLTRSIYLNIFIKATIPIISQRNINLDQLTNFKNKNFEFNFEFNKDEEKKDKFNTDEKINKPLSLIRKTSFGIIINYIFIMAIF